jgi:hypothetical protein
VITEYWPTPERWFVGRRVAAPGIPGLHRVDWLYSGSGLAMEGGGIGLDGRIYHYAGPYGASWVNADGVRTTPCVNGLWTAGRPVWLAFGWRNAAGAVTFPLETGDWSNGPAARTIPPPPGLRFAAGPARLLRYWHSVAVDPGLIPEQSRIFIPAYCTRPNHGWFLAQDTGGAILVRHVDIYRPAPASPDSGQMLTGQRVFVVPPGTRPRSYPRCP